MKPGERIREFRKNNGFNQAEFGQKLGYSQKFVSDIEIGKADPPRDFLIKLNEVFGISSDYILYGNPPDKTETGLAKYQEGYLEEKKGVMIIRELESKYQILPVATKKLIDNLVEILESGNKSAIEALESNIKAFLELVHISKKEDENKGGE